MDPQVEQFLAGGPHAVVGASPNRAKYGNKVLRVYQQTGRPVFPVHPTADEIEGLKAYPDLASLPEPVYGVSVITPPAVTEQIVRQAVALGIRHLWMQPGAESDEAIAAAREGGINVIAGGPCLLVVLGFRDD
ncbi:MAG: CoA-binding protein [Planctomycetales bacterium]|nr:CoA-binding protein [Planctomycetales bacterium]